MRRLRAIAQGIDALSEITAKSIRWLILFMMTITGYDVVLRYFFNAPTIWAYKLTGLLLGPLWLLSGAYVLLTDGHVRMDVFYRRLTPRKRAIVDLVMYTLFFFYCIFILIYGCDYFWTSFIRQDVSRGLWKPILWPFKVWVPVGVSLILLAGIAKYIRDLYMAITGRSLYEY